MFTALKFLNGACLDFEKEQYDFEAIEQHKEEIEMILKKRQLIACDDWKAFGEKLSGYTIAPFDMERYSGKEEPFLFRFCTAAMEQKHMVAKKIYESGNSLAGKIVERPNT